MTTKGTSCKSGTSETKKVQLWSLIKFTQKESMPWIGVKQIQSSYLQLVETIASPAGTIRRKKHLSAKARYKEESIT